jgi:hypothetical protein
MHLLCLPHSSLHSSTPPLILPVLSPSPATHVPRLLPASGNKPAGAVAGPHPAAGGRRGAPAAAAAAARAVADGPCPGTKPLCTHVHRRGRRGGREGAGGRCLHDLSRHSRED